MPTPRDQGEIVPAGWAHLLVEGCWLCTFPDDPRERLEVFLCAGDLLRGHRASLEAAWERFGPTLRRRRGTRSFAERVLAGESMRPTQCEQYEGG